MVSGGSKRQRVSAAYWFITFEKRGVAMTLIKWPTSPVEFGESRDRKTIFHVKTVVCAERCVWMGSEDTMEMGNQGKEDLAWTGGEGNSWRTQMDRDDIENRAKRERGSWEGKAVLSQLWLSHPLGSDLSRLLSCGAWRQVSECDQLADPGGITQECHDVIEFTPHT